MSRLRRAPLRGEYQYQYTNSGFKVYGFSVEEHALLDGLSWMPWLAGRAYLVPAGTDVYT